MHRYHLSIYDFSKRIGISKFGLTENIEKRIIIARGGISHVNTCIGGVGNGSKIMLPIWITKKELRSEELLISITM
jgi:hypothetical protein